MTETRKLKLSWQMKALAAALVLTPVLSLTTSIIQKSSIPTNSRGIASVSDGPGSATALDADSMDLSDLSVIDLKKAFKYQLLRDAHASHFQDSMSITLGLFIVRNEVGTKVFVCDRYPQIEVTIKSDKVQRTFQSDCRLSDDQNHIEAVSFLENSNSSGWHITGFRLLNDKKEDTLEISAKDLHAVLGSEISVEEIH